MQCNRQKERQLSRRRERERVYSPLAIDFTHPPFPRHGISEGASQGAENQAQGARIEVPEITWFGGGSRFSG